jgi:hypothetical protein
LGPVAVRKPTQDKPYNPPNVNSSIAEQNKAKISWKDKSFENLKLSFPGLADWGCKTVEVGATGGR